MPPEQISQDAAANNAATGNGQLAEQQQPENERCIPQHVVAVGASAGGLEALERLFSQMPDDTGCAFVVLQHLSPDFKSHMDELLSRRTKMPVEVATEGVAVEQNRIYLIPPNTVMIISDGKLLLTERDPREQLTLPIDHFFRSLAQDSGRNSVAIVLSGTGSDGSRGIQAVHEAGGLVLVQTPKSAAFDGMPRSAVKTGIVDLELEAEAMPDALIKYVDDALSRENLAEEEFTTVSEDGIDKLMRLLRSEYGIEFAHYKPTTVTRRVERRLSLAGVQDIEGYVERCREDSTELNSLYKDLLIGVTRFFRDAQAFERLAEDILPKLFEDANDGDEIRVWVAGCATGEEAYSLGILMKELVEKSKKRVTAKVFATDVHRTSLEFAGAGMYPEDALEEVTADRRNRFFTKRKDGYRVTPELRQMLVFAPHNVISDAPFTKMDLITCRNLLIYFQPTAQKKVLSLFHFALRTGGLLFLGSSETPGELKDEFEPLDKHWRIYRKRRDVRLPADVRMPLATTLQPISGEFARTSTLGSGRSHDGWPREMPERQLWRTYDRLLNRHMPPSILVDESSQVQHVFGGAEQFLHIRSGRPSTSILDLVDDALKTPLSGAMQHALREQATVRYGGVRLTNNDGVTCSYRLVVEPYHDGRANSTQLLIRLEPLEDQPEDESNGKPIAIDMDAMTQDHIQSLEGELRLTRENLQATIEELEASNEELQATNEEMVAANEELQSTNEELHSVNEELYTVNNEHQRKISELTQLTDDMDNLMVSTEVGVMFLDDELRIRQFTPRMGAMFHLLQQDIGRDIESFAYNLPDETLMDDVRTVLNHGETVEREVRDRNNVEFLLRVLPYRSGPRISGVVITVVDISKVKQQESKVARLSAIVESAHDAIIGFDLEGIIQSWNAGATELYGFSAEEMVGNHVAQLAPEESKEKAEEWLKQLARGESIADITTVRTRKDGREIQVSLRLSPIRDTNGKLVGAAKIVRDVSQLKTALDRIRDRESRIRLLLSSTAEAIVGVDMEGRCTFCNPAGLKILGYEKTSDLLNRNLHEVMHHTGADGKPLPLGDCPVHQTLETGKVVHRDDELLWRADGTSFLAELWSHPIESEGERHGAVVTFLDVTVRKTAERKASEANTHREQFLAVLSHELRNPLHAILNASRVIERQADGQAEIAETAQVLKRQSGQMGRLLDDLLDLTRVSQKKFNINKVPHDLRESARGALEEVRHRFDEADVELSVNLPSNPICVLGDPARLQQLQANLLSNAAKYTPSGGSVAFSIKSENDEAVISVTDSGIGMTPDAIEAVFQPFFQTDRAAEHDRSGLGVGLTLVKAITHAHEGAVIANSAGVDQGTQFLIRFSLHTDESAKSGETCSSDTTEIPKLRIVVVEDLADSQRTLKQLLEYDGHTVAVVGSGAAGVEEILNEQPDLALIDIGLPDIDGYEVAKRVRTRIDNGRPCLIALTGYSESRDKTRADEAGFDGHLAKPLDWEQLNAIIIERFGQRVEGVH